MNDLHCRCGCGETTPKVFACPHTHVMHTCRCVKIVRKATTQRTSTAAGVWGPAKPITIYLALDCWGREVAFHISEKALRSMLVRDGTPVVS